LETLELEPAAVAAVAAAAELAVGGQQHGNAYCNT